MLADLHLLLHVEELANSHQGLADILKLPFWRHSQLIRLALFANEREKAEPDGPVVHIYSREYTSQCLMRSVQRTYINIFEMRKDTGDMVVSVLAEP